ncbi:GNAT family N-acetyltransferase [Lentzea tibetensis]|uniref:GNAT family N-acetyltransferase n=1 Tax=Lentzea tibetensis TaxID=2591470 RepID=UPI001F34EEE5|nr:GNAT family protein [Lentzea tibetensis]
MQTERLDIRALTPDDAKACHSYQSLLEVTTYLYEDPRSLEETEQWIARATTGDRDSFVLIRRDTGELIGDIGIWPGEHGNAEFGYVLHPAHQGHGFATEAVRELVRFGFSERGYRRLVARIDGRNDASRKLLERLNFRREAHFVRNELVKGEWTDEMVFAMLDEEWAHSVERPKVPS